MPNGSWSIPHIRKGLYALALVAWTATGGCAAQSEMTNVWHDTTLAPGSLHGVLIVAIRKDPVRRRAWEDAFVGALAKRGVTATPSYREFASAPPDTQEVIDAVRQHGYDAVLTSVRLPDVATSRYVPGTYRAEPMSTMDYYGRFHSYLVSVQDPGYTENDTVIQVQTDVWTAAPATAHLVWSGTLRTLESVAPGGTVERAVNSYIMPELDKQGVFPGKTK